MLIFHVQTEGGIGMEQLETSLVPIPLEAEVEPLIPVLLTLRVVLFASVMYRVVTTMSSCIICVLNTCGVYITPVLMVIHGWLFATIIGSMGETNIRTSSCLILITRTLNKFWWEIPAESPANWTCTSLTVAPFQSFSMSFIVKFAPLLIRLFPTLFILKISTLSIRSVFSNFRLCWLYSCSWFYVD